jgi:hypothetical protein
MSGWVAGAVVVGGVAGSMIAADAAGDAADQQSASAQAGIDQQNQKFAAVQKLLLPYVQAGTGVEGVGGSLKAQQDLLGLNGNEAQQVSINGIKNSSQFTELAKQGEAGILQNASATGGLRGGNTQAALAQFRPAMLQQLINDQYAKLGGITSIGQNAAAGVGNAGMQTGNQITSLLQQQGAAAAGASLATGQAYSNAFGSIANGVGMVAGAGGFGGGYAPASGSAYGGAGVF